MSLDEFLDKQPAQPEDGIGLALSGGGYRAMVFHVGALIRLNEVALLRKIKRISSVSGGSITAGVLGTSWKGLKFTDDVAINFDVVVERVRQMADTTVDAGAIIGGILLPGSISDRVAKAYDKTLFQGARSLRPRALHPPGNYDRCARVVALWHIGRHHRRVVAN